MINNIICIVEGRRVALSLPAGITSIEVSSEGFSVHIDSESIHVNADRHGEQASPDLSLTAGTSDSKGFIWRTDAVMRVTDNGRIVGQNLTPGYASNIKPLASRPWTRRAMRPKEKDHENKEG